jgi:uncharacterized protein (DUF1778 family)
MRPTRRLSKEPSSKALSREGSAGRDERFTARLPHSEKSLLQRAAEYRGQTLSAYVFENARRAAIADLEEAGEIALAASDQQRFVQLLLEPPKPNAHLRRAIQAAESAAERG